MSHFVRAANLRHLLHTGRSISTCLTRPAVYSNDDYKPGPKPRTKEEHEAAAKKYGLHPSEYEPYPDNDGCGLGDYPKLPDVGNDNKDNFYPWDYPEHKRNFNEVMHIRAHLYGEDRLNIDMRPRYSIKVMLAFFLGTMGTIYGLYFLTDGHKCYRPVMEKQLPKPGVVHYTFEQNESVEPAPLSTETLSSESTELERAD